MKHTLHFFFPHSINISISDCGSVTFSLISSKRQCLIRQEIVIPFIWCCIICTNCSFNYRTFKTEVKGRKEPNKKEKISVQRLAAKIP